MKTKNFNFLRERDFNVRMSVVDEHLKNEEAQSAYEELIRDSLGVEIVNSHRVFIGNCAILKASGDIKSISFEARGDELLTTLMDEIRDSVSVRFNIRMITGGYKSWVISREATMCELLSGKDFNVRVSILDSNCVSLGDKIDEYAELVRDSLGETIVGNPNVVIGNLVAFRGDGSKVVRPFQFTGKSFMANIKPELRRCQAIRINIRLKQGGFKSWVIAQAFPF